MKKVIGLLFAGVLAIQSSGCCTILHGGNPDERMGQGKGQPRWGCLLLGNIFLGGLIGILVDLISGAAFDSAYVPAGQLPDGDPRKVYAVHLSDGTVLVLKDVHKPSEAEIKKARDLPKGVTAVKTEWVMRKSGS